MLDTSRTGLVWADELLAELERHVASDHGRFVLKRWLRLRRESFSLHRNALLERGLLRYKPTKYPRLFRFLERYYPDPVTRKALISQLQATNGQSRLDAHILLLSDLVDSCGLDKDLGVTFSWRQRLDRGRGAGMVASLPEALLDTSAVLAGSIPKRSRHQD